MYILEVGILVITRVNKLVEIYMVRCIASHNFVKLEGESQI